MEVYDTEEYDISDFVCRSIHCWFGSHMRFVDNKKNKEERSPASFNGSSMFH